MNATATHRTAFQPVERNESVDLYERGDLIDRKIICFTPTVGGDVETSPEAARIGFSLRGVLKGYLGALVSWLGVFAVAAFVKGFERVPAWILGGNALEFAEVRHVAILSTIAWLALALPAWALLSGKSVSPAR